MREYSVFDKDKQEISYLRSLKGMFALDKRLLIDQTLKKDGKWENEFFIIRSISTERIPHD